jgi:hypothetical protein
MQGNVITLDRPPLDGTTSIDKDYFIDDLDTYGKNYKDHSDINAGHILYYVDKDRKDDPFYKHIFHTPSNFHKTTFTDPMGRMTKHYKREVTKDKINEDKTLSWISDSQEHREDIMSLQMSKQNHQRY